MAKKVHPKIGWFGGKYFLCLNGLILQVWYEILRRKHQKYAAYPPANQLTPYSIIVSNAWPKFKYIQLGDRYNISKQKNMTNWVPVLSCIPPILLVHLFFPLLRSLLVTNLAYLGMLIVLNRSLDGLSQNTPEICWYLAHLALRYMCLSKSTKCMWIVEVIYVGGSFNDKYCRHSFIVGMGFECSSFYHFFWYELHNF